MSDKFLKDFPRCLTIGDSAVVALRAVQTVLQDSHFDPFPQLSGFRGIARLLNLLPVATRVKIADFISASIGSPHTEFKKINPGSVAEWVVSGYPSHRYSGVILGAPGLAATFLSGLTGYPFLPQPLLFNAGRNMRPDDAQGYLDAGREIAEPLLGEHRSIEATIHFDPVHDRFLIGRVVFVRLKFLDLPDAYRQFIEHRLAPGSPVILLDCRYSWPRAEVSERLYFQLGGLGGITPQEYLDETQALITYREQWGGTADASWKIEHAYSEGPESEWGSVGNFLDDAEEISSRRDHRTIRITHHHPGDLSRGVFNLYRHCRQGSTEPTDVYIAAFTHTEPRFPLVTGCLPIWMPFITDDNVRLVDEILSEWKGQDALSKPSGTAYVTLHPSFCSPPDIVQLPTWRELLSKYFADVRFLGIDPGRYPFDLGSYVMMYPALVAAARSNQYPGIPFRKPTITDLGKILLGA